jgi:hypothetical protein
MLRSRSRGVAEKSQHMLGKALDFYIPDVSLRKLREIGVKFQVGGVGFYPTSGSPFVHMDVGGVRAWPRLPRRELARLFPDGKTLHHPAEGGQMPGYAAALAGLQAPRRFQLHSWSPAATSKNSDSDAQQSKPARACLRHSSRVPMRTRAISTMRRRQSPKAFARRSRKSQQEEILTASADEEEKIASAGAACPAGLCRGRDRERCRPRFSRPRRMLPKMR